MRTIQIGVFSYTGRSEGAKQRVRHDWQCSDGYNWEIEAMASLKALAEHFGCVLKDWEVDWFGSTYSYATFVTPDEQLDVDEFAALLGKLGSYNEATGEGHGDCELTGYCMDESAIDGMRKHWLTYGEPDLDKLMQAAFKSWLEACQEDCEYQYSDEAMAENCEANSYEFFQDGEMVRKG